MLILMKRLTREEFIKKAKAIHRDFYDYSLVVYVNSYTKVKIICPIHGIFEQIPNGHLERKGCLYCSNNFKSNTEEFIKKAKAIHGDKYDYSEVDYQSNKVKVKIICQKCGHIFWQIPNSHLLGKGCPYCKGQNKNTEIFIQESKLIHGNKYDYSLVIYQSSKIKIKIICRKCRNIFKQTPGNHLQGQSCPNCVLSEKKSKGEKELCDFIKSIYPGKVLENTREFIGRKELDIYLPELKLALEYNGEYWHKIHEEKEPGYHENKRQLCKNAGITLIEVWDSQWKTNAEIIKKEISEHLQKIREKL